MTGFSVWQTHHERVVSCVQACCRRAGVLGKNVSLTHPTLLFLTHTRTHARVASITVHHVWLRYDCILNTLWPSPNALTVNMTRAHSHHSKLAPGGGGAPPSPPFLWDVPRVVFPRVKEWTPLRSLAPAPCESPPITVGTPPSTVLQTPAPKVPEQYRMPCSRGWATPHGLDSATLQPVPGSSQKCLLGTVFCLSSLAFPLGIPHSPRGWAGTDSLPLSPLVSPSLLRPTTLLFFQQGPHTACAGTRANTWVGTSPNHPGGRECFPALPREEPPSHHH